MRINYKKVLGITLAGLMAVAPMVSSASQNGTGMTKSVEATVVVEAEVGDADNKESVGVMVKSTEAAKSTEALETEKEN